MAVRLLLTLGLISPILKNSPHAFVTTACLIAESAYAPMIAVWHRYDTLSCNTHDAADIINNLLAICQPQTLMIALLKQNTSPMFSWRGAILLNE